MAFPYDCRHCGDSYNGHAAYCPEGQAEERFEQERKAAKDEFIGLLQKHGIMFTVAHSAYGSVSDVKVFNSDLLRFLKGLVR